MASVCYETPRGWGRARRAGEGSALTKKKALETCSAACTSITQECAGSSAQWRGPSLGPTDQCSLAGTGQPSCPHRLLRLCILTPQRKYPEGAGSGARAGSAVLSSPLLSLDCRPRTLVMASLHGLRSRRDKVSGHFSSGPVEIGVPLAFRQHPLKAFTPRFAGGLILAKCPLKLALHCPGSRPAGGVGLNLLSPAPPGSSEPTGQTAPLESGAATCVSQRGVQARRGLCRPASF